MEDKEFSFDTNIILVTFIILLVLKLAKYITWSWWWIFSPFWIPALISIIIVVVHKFIFFVKNKWILV